MCWLDFLIKEHHIWRIFGVYKREMSARIRFLFGIKDVRERRLHRKRFVVKTGPTLFEMVWV